MTDLSIEQSLPIPNTAPSIQSLVRADLETREAIGIGRYGTALQPFNGRDAMRDLYEELLDAACYTRQMIAERDQADTLAPPARRRGAAAGAQLMTELQRLRKDFESLADEIAEASSYTPPELAINVQAQRARAGAFQRAADMLAQIIGRSDAGSNPCAGGCSDPAAHVEGGHDV